MGHPKETRENNQNITKVDKKEAYVNSYIFADRENLVFCLSSANLGENANGNGKL